MGDSSKSSCKSGKFPINDLRVATVIGVMNKSFAGHLSVAALSKHVNLSATRLRQLFKQETGRSPMQYLRDLRMRQAERLLRTTFLSIKEISFFIGAKDISHFVRDFKNDFGVTPSEFRGRGRSQEHQPAERYPVD
jgi:transcriptional regulator GlxA family with amidase domain